MRSCHAVAAALGHIKVQSIGDSILISSFQVGVPRSVKATAAGRPEVSAAAATAASAGIVATAATETSAAATTAEAAAHMPLEAKLPLGGNDVGNEEAGTDPDAPAESETVGGPGDMGPSGPSAPLLSGASSLAAGHVEGLHQGPGSSGGGGGSGTAVVLTRSDRKRQWKQLRRDKKARRGDPETAAAEASPAPAWIPGEWWTEHNLRGCPCGGVTPSPSPPPPPLAGESARKATATATREAIDSRHQVDAPR